jgi:hypothetical protein
VYKLGKIHVVVDALSKLLDIIEPIGVPDQTTVASLFYTRPKWLNDVKEFFRIGQIKGTLSVQQKHKLVKRS